MNSAIYTIRHQAVALVVIVLVIVAGILAFNKLGRLEDPEFTIKEAVISTYYPGATAEQTESEVTERIETAIQQLKQLKEVRSISRAGHSIIFVEIQEFYDKETLPQVWDELRRKVNSVVGQLPPGCHKPVVNDDFGDVYGVFFALTGDGYSAHELNEIADDLRRELLLCKDVGRIAFWGKQTEVIYVEICRNKLAQLGLTPQVIFNSIKRQNAIPDAGKVHVGTEDIHLRVSGDFSSVDDLKNQLIKVGATGKMVRLKDIAKVKRGYIDPPHEILKWNGRPALGIGISTVSGGDVIAMGDDIKRSLKQLSSRIPYGVKIHSIAHQSETVKKSVDGFVLNLFAAVVIVILLLIIFMGIREGFIIGLVLILTIFCTFLCMLIMGITLQRISLGGLIIALGMLVDNAIVVAEGIVTKLHNGYSKEKAAAESVSEAQWPLLGATGIAILAFAAITLSKDMTGEWLQSLFQVICLSLGLSWLFAITVTPYLCYVMLPDKMNHTQVMYTNLFYRKYRSFVETCINHRWMSIGAVIVILGVAMWAMGFVKQDFMPDMNRPQLMVNVRMPEGTHINRTAAEVDRIDKYIRSLDGVTDVSSFTGRGPLRFLLTYEPEMPDNAYGQLLVSLTSYQKIPEIRNRLFAYLSKNHPRAVTSVDAFKLGPGGGAVVARLSGPEGNVLLKLAEEVKAVMRANSNSRSIRTDWGMPVKVCSIKTANIRSHGVGITRPEIAQSLKMNYSGIVSGIYRKGDDLLPIILRPPAPQRKSSEHMDNVPVWSSLQHDWVPLEQIAHGLKIDWEFPVIHRLNRKRVLRVQCKQINGTTDSLFRQLKRPIENIRLPKGYTLEWGGEHEEQVEANSKLMSNVPIAFILMFLISVMLFNSLKHPLIIFLGLPLTVIGVAGGMLLADKPFGFMAMLGFLSLSGMLIKNEIVLLDQINLEIASGKHKYQAVVDSAVSRVRPVVMAAFTTVFGMIPLLWDAFFAPMAVTIMGGLTFATILTLVIVPVLYSTIFKVRKQHL